MGNNFRVKHGTASDLHFAPLAGKTDGSLFVQMRGNAVSAHRVVYGSTTPEVTRSIRDALNDILGDTPTPAPALPEVVVDPVPDEDGDTIVRCGARSTYVSKDGKGAEYGVESIKESLEYERKDVTAADFTPAALADPFSRRNRIAALEKALELAEERAARSVFTREGDLALVGAGINANGPTTAHAQTRIDARAAAARLRENAYAS